MPFALLDIVERRYDGPPLPDDPAMRPVDATARARLFERLAAEAGGEAARRRRLLPGRQALADRRLAALGRALVAYRGLGIGWRVAAGD